MLPRVRENQEKQLLKKHADLILCSNPMTLIQRKIFNVLLYNAFPEIQENKAFDISLRDLCKLIGYTSRNYVSLIDAIEGLTSLNIKWRVIDSKTKIDDIISASCAVITSIFVKNGTCVYKYNEDIKHKLSHPGIYGKLDLEMQAKMKSSFALVLYEICEKFKNVGQTGWLDISDVRKLMGVKKNGYKLYLDFERNVLNRAVKEVNDKTNFVVTFEKRRDGRAVKYVKFVIGRVSAFSSPEDSLNNNIEKPKELEVDLKALKIMVSDFLIPKNTATKLIRQKGEKYIQEKIELIKSSPSYKNGQIKNRGGLLISAINNDYKAESKSDSINDAIRKKVIEQEQKRREQKLKESFRKHQIGEILVNFRRLSSEEQGQIEDDFYCNASDRTVKRYCEQGLNNDGAREDFVRFIENFKHKYHYLITNLTSFDEYAAERENMVLSELN